MRQYGSRKLPQQFSCVAIGCICHPPHADNVSMHDYLINCVDSILRLHPSCGIIVTGDFNQLRDAFLYTHYSFKQVVDSPTQHLSILDKIWTNLSHIYDKLVLLELGTSDHNVVLFSPSRCHLWTLATPSGSPLGAWVTERKLLLTQQFLKLTGDDLFNSESCHEKFSIYQSVLNLLLQSCFPTKIMRSHGSLMHSSI